MQRVNWDGRPLEVGRTEVPDNLQNTIFSYLPPVVPVTPVIRELAHRYLNEPINPQDYAAMQAAAFLCPETAESHENRRQTFRTRMQEAEAEGFAVPKTFQTLVESDEYVDRLHHNCIWLQMPEELWRLPGDPTKLVFLAFTEGQGCCHWHLLLDPDGTHCMMCCEHPFGLRSAWLGEVPDYSQWTARLCADSIEEWLFHFFRESAEGDQRYLNTLLPYQSR